MVILLAFIQYFWPTLHAIFFKPATKVVVAVPRAVPAPGIPAPVIGSAARLCKGLLAVEPALAPAVTGLAEGSAAAQERQFAICRERNLPYETSNSIGLRFRLIPPGTFLMGSPVGEVGRGDGEMQHEVMIPEPFYLSVFEINQDQWMKIMHRNPSSYLGGNRPVEEVTWEECRTFVQTLCERENVTPGTYRLPLEEEWEYACRAGTTTAFCFGNDMRRLKDYADYNNNNDTSTVPCGSRKPNAYGIYDLHGNVWEWCQNYFRPYFPKPGAEPGTDEDWRVIRGGNWHEPAENCRSANRARLPPLSHGNMLGFRIVRLLRD